MKIMGLVLGAIGFTILGAVGAMLLVGTRTPENSTAAPSPAPTARASVASPAPVLRSAPLEALGLTIGKPLGIQKCKDKLLVIPGVDLKGMDIKVPERPCIKYALTPDAAGASAPSSFRFVFLPMLPYGIQDEPEGYVVDGVLAGMKLTTEGESAQAGVESTLVEKYGPPSTRELGEVQNRMGAKFSKVTATWHFANLDVTFVGMGSTIDSGEISILSPAGKKYLDERNEAYERDRVKL